MFTHYKFTNFLYIFIFLFFLVCKLENELAKINIKGVEKKERPTKFKSILYMLYMSFERVLTTKWVRKIIFPL